MPFAANEWIGVFQKNPFNQACLEGKSNGSTEIMLRPSFPQWFRGQQVPKHFSKSEVIARVCDTWKVGDWVDWHNKDCYWTGQIIELTSKTVVEVNIYSLIYKIFWSSSFVPTQTSLGLTESVEKYTNICNASSQ